MPTYTVAPDGPCNTAYSTKPCLPNADAQIELVHATETQLFCCAVHEVPPHLLFCQLWSAVGLNSRCWRLVCVGSLVLLVLLHGSQLLHLVQTSPSFELHAAAVGYRTTTPRSPPTPAATTFCYTCSGAWQWGCRLWRAWRALSLLTAESPPAARSLCTIRQTFTTAKRTRCHITWSAKHTAEWFPPPVTL